jgi:ABC-type transporter Mla maintaining outer membrane lipid asymmetry permease subunit MlaE
MLICVPLAGTVYVFLKDSIFQASDPTRHTAELGRQLKTMYPNAVAIIIFTDGGPDHNCKHTSV